jgi:RNA polymerase sigma-70 factor, ECF subfamily
LPGFVRHPSDDARWENVTMDRQILLANRFEADRVHLRAVAYRMLGSAAEADDAVQEAWLRLSRSDATDIANLTGWLTTVIARVSLDMLRSRRTRREEALAPEISETATSSTADPEQAVEMADSLGLALLVVLETLSPAERVAFVLHDMFGLPFEEIAGIVDRSPGATRQLASRARRRVRCQPSPKAARERHRAVVAAFLEASRGGDFATLLALLDPDVALRADAVAVAASRANRAQGAPELVPELRGAEGVARTFVGRAHAARIALIDGSPGLIVVLDGLLRVAFLFTASAGRITGIELVADPARLDAMAIAPEAAEGT